MKRIELMAVVLGLGLMTGCASLPSFLNPNPTVDTTSATLKVAGVQNQVVGLLAQGCAPQNQQKLNDVNTALNTAKSVFALAGPSVDATAAVAALTTAQAVAMQIDLTLCSPQFADGVNQVGKGIQDLVNLFK